MTISHTEEKQTAQIAVQLKSVGKKYPMRQKGKPGKTFRESHLLITLRKMLFLMISLVKNYPEK